MSVLTFAERSKQLGEIWFGDEKLVFVEYIHGKPINVVTAKYWDHSGFAWFNPAKDAPTGTCPEHYDFEWSRTHGNIYYHNSGCGGDYEITLSKWIGSVKQINVWADPIVQFVVDVKRKGEWTTRPATPRDWLRLRYRRLRLPKLISGSRNPFEYACESRCEWCPKCKDWLPTDDTDSPCEHMTWCDGCAMFVDVKTRQLVGEADGQLCDCEESDE